jgi:hypothetical protein
VTAVCGGGPSEVRPLVNPVIDMTGTSAGALATLWGFPELAVPIALAAGALNFATNVVCVQDPPPDPGLTQQDIVDATAVMDPIRALPAQARVEQWFRHRYWWEICQCVSGATPAPPLMSDPNTGVGVGYGAPSGANPAPCWIGTGALNVTIPQMSGHVYVEPWLPAGPGSTINVPSVNAPFVCIPPPGTKSVSWRIQHTSSTVPHKVKFGAYTVSGGNTNLATMGDSAISGVQTGKVAYDPVTSSRPYCAIQVVSEPAFFGNWQANWTGEVSFDCGTPGSTIVQPCCPPDPLLDIKLNQILGLVMGLYNRVEGPIAWVDGTRHSGLTGKGQFQLTGQAVAIRVEVTRLPDHPDILDGNPLFYWNMGFITPLAFDTPLRGWRLVFQHQTFTLQNVTDAIAYTLLDNTGIDVVELLASAP